MGKLMEGRRWGKKYIPTTAYDLPNAYTKNLRIAAEVYLWCRGSELN